MIKNTAVAPPLLPNIYGAHFSLTQRGGGGTHWVSPPFSRFQGADWNIFDRRKSCLIYPDLVLRVSLYTTVHSILYVLLVVMTSDSVLSNPANAEDKDIGMEVVTQVSTYNLVVL